MSEQSIPTLDGMTPAQFTDIVVGQAMLRARSEFEREGMEWDERLVPTMEFGAQCGVLACWLELNARGLVVEKP
jgi:hypothetical protein